MVKFGSNKPQNTQLSTGTPVSPAIVDSEDLAVPTTLENQFFPSNEQRRLKSRWWFKYTDGCYTTKPEEMSYDQVMKVLSSRPLERWWKLAGFKEWFLNKEEETEKVELLYSIALDEIEEIVRSRDPKYLKSKIAMIRLVCELADKFPKNKQIQYVDKQIATMNPDELKKFIIDKANKVLEAE